MAIVDIQGSLRRCGFRRNRGVNIDGGVVSRTVAGEAGWAEPEGIVTVDSVVVLQAQCCPSLQ